MKLLLINPNFQYRFGRYQGGSIKAVHSPPLGLIYVAAACRQHDHEVQIVDMTLDNLQPRDVGSILKETRPDAVGIAASMAFNLVPALYAAEEIKKIRPELPVIFGGIQCTFQHSEILQSNQFVDIIVRFEAEDSLPLVLDVLASGQWDFRHIPEISYRNRSGELVKTSTTPKIMDLDRLPLPAWDLLQLSRYPSNTQGIMMTSRGCPYMCAFCSTTVFNGKKMRYHSVERVVDEILELKKTYGISTFLFADDTFTVNKRRVYELCEAFCSKDLNISWGCDTRADLLDPDLLKAMKRSGLSVIFFGIESVSQISLDVVHKHLKVDLLRNAMHLCKTLDIKVIESFIIGLPHQTYDSVDEISTFIKETRPNEVLFNMMIVYPGTDMYSHPEHYGIKRYSTDWIKSEQSSPMVETEWMNADDIRRAYVKLVRNLERDFPRPRAISLFDVA